MGIIANKLQQESGAQPQTATSSSVISRALEKQNKPKEPNLIQGLAQDIARPFERIGGAVINALDLGNIRARGGQQPTVRPGAFGGEVEQLGYKGGEKLTGFNLAKDVVGTGLEAGSMFIPGTVGLKGASTLAKVGKAAVTGGTTGAAYGIGRGLQEEETIRKAATSAVLPTIGGALTGGTLPLLGKVASELPKIGGKGVKKYASDIAENSVKKEIGELLTNTRGISNKVREAAQKNVDLVEKLSDPQVYKGIKVVNSRVEPDEAIRVLDNRIDAVLDAKRKLLPELDRLTPEIPREVLRQKAVNDILGQNLLADEEDLIRAINKQIDAYPETIKISDIDAIRAKARKSARDARGIQKRDNEYVAIENAARDTVFEVTDNLKIPNASEYKSLNDYIRSMIETKTFLDKTLRAQPVKGGRLGRVSGRMIGAIAGSQGGVLGTLLGSEVGGAVADILINNSLGSSVKAKLIREITDDPEILKVADDLLKSAKQLEVPRLPSPTSQFRTQQGSGPTIQLGKLQSVADKNSARFGKQYPQVNLLQLPAGNPQSPPTGLPTIQSLSSRSDRAVGFPDSNPSISRQNTQNTITTNVANSSIPGTIAPKGKGASGKLPGILGLPLLGQKQQGLENEEIKFLEPKVVEGVYTIPSRKVTVEEPDLEELGAILFGEIGNRPLDKKLLEARTIANIALNRAEKEGKSLAEVLRQPNQFQAYKGNQYNLYKSGKAATSTISKEKVDAVNKILDEIRQGTLKNNIGDNLSYAHRKDNTIRVYKDWSEQKKDLNNIK